MGVWQERFRSSMFSLVTCSYVEPYRAAMALVVLNVVLAAAGIVFQPAHYMVDSQAEGTPM